MDTDTGEYQEKRLTHPGEAEQFYRCLASPGQAVRVGMEASGHGRWFERLLEELRIELWRGDATVIRAKRGRKQKTDREDARHILKLLRKDDFPRIWVPSLGESREGVTCGLASVVNGRWALFGRV
jgi:transposase